MRVLIYEELCGSGMVSRGEATASLLAEGRAMLGGLLEDAADCPGVEVVTVLDPAAGLTPPDTVHVLPPSAWPGVIDEVDAVWVIAPETAGILAERCRQVEARGKRLIGPSSEQVELWSDKLRSAAALGELGIPTQRWSESTFTGDRVLKPIDGAGCLNTGLIRADSNWPDWLDYRQNVDRRDWIVQPYKQGVELSTAIVTSPTQGSVILPVCQQRIRIDERGKFGYFGGILEPNLYIYDWAVDLADAFLDQCDEHDGYIGLDVIVIPYDPENQWIVEVNPRLTTSYVLYRYLFGSQLVRWILNCDGGAGFAEDAYPFKQIATLDQNLHSILYDPNGALHFYTHDDRKREEEHRRLRRQK